MNHENTFSYTYRAQKNQEVWNIRKIYLPREESESVQSSGMTASLCAGIGGALLFGLGMCLTMTMPGQLVWLGVILSLFGAAGMILAYPLYLK